MSWGERSCKKPCRCPESCDIDTCNVNCKEYQWDEKTAPDSIKFGKYRMKSWYWGNYCQQLESGRWIDNHGKVLTEGTWFKMSTLEPYVEEEHGWHHSEEHKKGEDINGGKYKNT